MEKHKNIAERFVKFGVFNYMYYFIHVYWVFILTSLSVPLVVITFVVSTAQAVRILSSYLFGKFRNKVNDDKPIYYYVVILGFIECLLILGISFFHLCSECLFTYRIVFMSFSFLFVKTIGRKL